MSPGRERGVCAAAAAAAVSTPGGGDPGGVNGTRFTYSLRPTRAPWTGSGSGERPSLTSCDSLMLILTKRVNDRARRSGGPSFIRHWSDAKVTENK